eukprot:TRINITY_DN2291_c0_g1_i1.p1 TRINITY_DN2291_c0_g1~~TRINITY_DN2291_c0_g1_i1.p1  ORF type:complete len:292 (-),score=57.52 TRINITY_DN2291_c0_g1_i1:16-891(-)
MAKPHNEIPFEYEEVTPGMNLSKKSISVKEIIALREKGCKQRAAIKGKGISFGVDGLEDDSENDEAGTAPDAPEKEIPIVKGTEAEPHFSVFISGIPSEVQEEQLASLFADCGPIVKAFIWRKHNGQSKMKGFVSFATTEAMQAALNMNEKATLLGKLVKIEEQKHQPPDEVEEEDEDDKLRAKQPKPSLNIFIRNIYPNTPEPVLRKHFASCGSISECRLMPKKRCAIVSFEKLEAAAAALKLTGTKLMGQVLEINYDSKGGLKRVMSPEMREVQRAQAPKKQCLPEAKV